MRFLIYTIEDKEMINSKNKNLVIVIAFISIVIMLCGCGKIKEIPTETTDITVEESPEITPMPTPKSAPAPTPRPEMPVEVDEDGTYYIYDTACNIYDDIINLSHVRIYDDGELLEQVIPCLENLKYIDLDSSGLTNERCAQIRDTYPDVEVIWRVDFKGYSVRTNVTKILASKPGTAGNLYAEDVDVLKYCTKVRYLDIGHNEQLTDISFIQYMPELEIAVISMTKPESVEAFLNCKNLLYLEAGNCGLDDEDVKVLGQCKSLKHLNIGTNQDITDISPLYNLDLLRLWLGVNDGDEWRLSVSVPTEQYEKMRELHPDCEVNDTVIASGEAYTIENWKYFQQMNNEDWGYYATNGVFRMGRPLGYYKVVYKAFQYYKGDAAYAFAWFDPKYNSGDVDISPVNTFVLDTSQLSVKFEYPDYNNVDNLIPDELESPPGQIISESKY